MSNLPLTHGDRFPELAATVLKRAKALGATEADLLVAEGDSVSVQVRMSEVDRLSKAREKVLGIRVFFGKRSASSSTSDFSKVSLDRLVSDTCSLAKAVVEDETSGLPAPDQMVVDIPDMDMKDDRQLAVDEEIDLAKRTEQSAFSADPRITNSEGAECSAGYGSILLANSHGFVGSYASSSYSLSVSPIALDSQNGGMQRDYWYSVKRKFHELDSPESVGQEAARRTVRRLGSRAITTQEVPVIFDPETAKGLLGHISSAVSGYSLYKGASFLLGQLGKSIASDMVTVVDDGRLAGGLGSRPFDGEGLPTRKTLVIDRGVLSSYLLDTYSGRKLGMASTGNASRSVGENPTVGATNLFLSPGSYSPDEILKSMKRGLYVTDLIGFGVNLVTGDYSRGAVGFWVENGELTHPVEEVTIAGNLQQILKDIEMVGNDLEFRGRVASPTVKIRKMMVAGH
ncbi:TldD/PmbA family protein [Candidatus Nitrospira allomarina]|jgi:PmbA protein|uniref:TldD/PmbA family protein n=1 Tax=Candidatus Nitrospira allomarina TaxID=3020900 RepID=A0AA96GCY8_9BACT|nr:TldD/PmbA family protein [Candidatus Nitrospira allomarina]WNM57895.1 TldD/PmbA family protein [Candidatus Nitrospira allomarina]